MIYNTGTISVSGNTATGTGTNWTASASQVRAGQTIIVMSNPVQMYQITTVNSATSLTVTPAASPALSGQKYGILVTDSLSVDGLAQSISLMIKEYDENIGAWESFASTTANQNVTVTINGASVTIPAIGKLLQKGTNGALAVNQGGTGATTKEDGRTNLGLGNAATRSAQTTMTESGVGLLMQTGAFGLGSSAPDIIDNNANNVVSYNGFVSGAGASGTGYANPYGPMLVMRRISAVAQFQVLNKGVIAARYGTIDGFPDPWATQYSTANTTKASDGTLKAASPVARIVKSQEENQRTDLVEEGFNWCGCGAANDEAEGIIISRLDVGVYVLTGSSGLASEGWQLLPPMDPGGMGELGVVEAVQTESGGLTIRLYRRKYMMNDEGEIVKTKGELMDVPASSWIDIRLDMPANSIWNQRQAEVNVNNEISNFENQQDGES